MTLTAAALRVDPGFRRFVAARVVSMAGTLITAVVLPVLMYRLTGAVAWTAAVVVAESLPHLLFAPVAAPLAAWLNRRRLVYLPDLAGAALLGGIPLAWWQGVLSGWHLLVVACAVQVLFVLLDAAQTGALQILVGPGPVAAGRAALQGSTSLAELMVPPLAGLAVVIVAPAGLLTLDATSFLASALLVRAALRRRPESAPEPPRRARLRAGLRLLRATAPSRAMAVTATLHAAAAAAYLAVLLPWADQHLHVAPSGDARLALLVSCWGLGAIGGRSLSPALIRRLGPVRLARWAAAVLPGCGFAVLACTHWLPAVLAGLLWGAAHAVSITAVRHTLGPPVRSVTRVLWHGAGPVLGAALAGAVAVLSTPRAGLAVGVALLVVAALAVPRGTAPLPPGSVPTQPGPAGDRERDRRRKHGADRGRDRGPRTLADRAGHGDVTPDPAAPRAGP